MKIRCIDVGCNGFYITLGMIYEVVGISENDLSYRIINDRGNVYYAPKFLFQVVKEDLIMKFKVGDKVKVIDGGVAYTTDVSTANELIRKSNGKAFKWEKGFGSEIGPNWRSFNGIVGEIIALEDDYALVNLIINNVKRSVIFRTAGLEYLEPQTELTFKEVIARIKPGETYVCTYYSNTQEIRRDKKGKIILKLSQSMHIKDEVHITSKNKFKLQEPKKQVKIYKVEHKQGGKKYDFISSQLLQEGMFVVCDTSQGKSYGRIVDIGDRELTEQEIKQYKECWRA
ncbi:hypothetical protein [Clostridium sp.]|uniref:hypothetical protein n=1 Tax=Clostridium sp. TaxID=1506 RepID=UPI003216805F